MVSVVSVHLNYLVKQTDRQMAANPHTKLTYLGSESASRLLPSHCHLLLLLSPKVDNLFLSFLSSCKTRRLSNSVHGPCSRLYIRVAVMVNATANGEIRAWIISHCCQACYHKITATCQGVEMSTPDAACGPGRAVASLGLGRAVVWRPALLKLFATMSK